MLGSQRTFCVDPVCVQIRQGGLVAELLNGLGRLVVDLKNATRSPPPAGLVRHDAVRSPTTGRVGARLVRDRAREEYWGRQFGGV
jgi:hypothetical protein